MKLTSLVTFTNRAGEQVLGRPSAMVTEKEPTMETTHSKPKVC